MQQLWINAVTQSTCIAIKGYKCGSINTTLVKILLST